MRNATTMRQRDVRHEDKRIINVVAKISINEHSRISAVAQAQNKPVGRLIRETVLRAIEGKTT